MIPRSVKPELHALQHTSMCASFCEIFFTQEDLGSWSPKDFLVPKELTVCSEFECGVGAKLSSNGTVTLAGRGNHSRGGGGGGGVGMCSALHWALDSQSLLCPRDWGYHVLYLPDPNPTDCTRDWCTQWVKLRPCPSCVNKQTSDGKITVLSLVHPSALVWSVGGEALTCD